MTSPIPLWIDGKPVTSQTTFSYANNATKAATFEVSTASGENIDQAIASGKQAFKTWRDVPAWQKRDILNKFGDIYESKRALFAELYRKETPVDDITIITDFDFGLGHIREAASVCTQIKGDVPSARDGSTNLILREPYGIVFAIPPFNFAATLVLRTIVYPLACSNVVLMKGNERLPQFIVEIAKSLTEAGLPDGVFNVVQLNPASVPKDVESIIANREVRCVTFTGSPVVGKIVASHCGKYSKPILLELGGKAPAIVLPDADFATAANNVLFAATVHGGQTCMATEVIYAVGPVAKKGIQDAVAAIVSEKVLPDFDLIAPESATKLKALWKDAEDKGAKLLTPKSDTSGVTVNTAIFADITKDMRIYTEESFGPSVSIVEVATVEEAIEEANSSEFGLSASVWTADYFQAIEIAKKIDSGAVHINHSTVHDEATLPHGGYKNSGFGRFNGSYAIQSFTQTKSITMRKPGTLPLHLLRAPLLG